MIPSEIARERVAVESKNTVMEIVELSEVFVRGVGV
jgi:hypothetical protein